MPRDPQCDFCTAGAPNLVGICTDCDGCFGEHCKCDPCQHGKKRTDECVFCGRGYAPDLVGEMMVRDNLDDDIKWLFGDVDA